MRRLERLETCTSAYLNRQLGPILDPVEHIGVQNSSQTIHGCTVLLDSLYLDDVILTDGEGVKVEDLPSGGEL